MNVMNADVESNESINYAGLYEELYGIIKTTLASKIDKKRIEDIIRKIVKVFQEDMYNPLMMYFFLTSSENYLISHITNNVILAIGFGVSVNLSEENLHKLGLCAFCHDFGMREYAYLFQKDKKLLDSENRILREHLAKSAEMFQGVFSEDIILAIQDVHEQVDGRGYPKGKQGTEINFLARVTAVCDVYEALTHSRNSRKKFTPYDAIKILITQKDVIFDENVIKRFLDYMAIYPIGSLIYLNTGEIGIVVAGNYGHPTRCKVRVLLTADQEVDNSNKFLDLLQDTMVYVSKSVPPDEEDEILRVLKPRGVIEPHTYY